MGYLLERALTNELRRLLDRPRRGHPGQHGPGRQGRPGLRQADQAGRPLLHRVPGPGAHAQEEVDHGRGRRPRLAQGRRLAQAHRRDRQVDHQGPGRKRAASSSPPAAAASRSSSTPRAVRGRRGGHRQGLRLQPDRPRSGGRSLHHPDRPSSGSACDFGKPSQRELAEITVGEAERLLAEGQFPAGSMGPKIRAAIDYIRAGGREVLITDANHLKAALIGRSGTRIVPDPAAAAGLEAHRPPSRGRDRHHARETKTRSGA